MSQFHNEYKNKMYFFFVFSWFVDHSLAIALKVVNESTDMHYPVVEMTTRSKLSCLSWNNFAKNHIASSDYEGIVTVWDVNTRQVIIWSIMVRKILLGLCKMHIPVTFTFGRV